MNVGYSFVNILLRHDNGKIGVDMNLLNDVVEQNGGGGEPFIDVIEPDLLDVAAGVATDAAERIVNTTQTVVHDHIIGTAEDTAERMKAKVVHFKDVTTTGGRDENVESEEIEGKPNDSVHTSQEIPRTGAKKDV